MIIGHVVNAFRRIDAPGCISLLDNFRDVGYFCEAVKELSNLLIRVKGASWDSV